MRRIFASFAALLLLGGGVLLVDWHGFSVDTVAVDLTPNLGPDDDPDSPDASPTSAPSSSEEEPSTEPTDSDSPSDPDPAGPSDVPSAAPTSPPTYDGQCDDRLVVQGFLEDEGFEPSDYTLGPGNVRWDDIPVMHVQDAFSDTPLRTRGELNRFLQRSDPAAIKARELIGAEAAVFDAPNFSDQWVAVQFHSPVLYSGNWYWKDGQAVKGGDQKLLLGGDVWWFYVNRSCTVETRYAVRAICGNVGLDAIEPYVKD